MTKFEVVYLIGLATITLAGLFMFWLGKRAAKDLRATTTRVFRLRRSHRLIVFSVAVLGLCVMTPLPFLSSATSMKSWPDTVAMVGIVAFWVWGILEGLNRRIAFAPTHLVTASFTGSLCRLSFGDVKKVSFHDFYGGFFLVRSRDARLYVPVQVDEPTELIDLLERHIDSAVLRPVRPGIALCRFHLR